VVTAGLVPGSVQPGNKIVSHPSGSPYQEKTGYALWCSVLLQKRAGFSAGSALVHCVPISRCKKDSIEFELPETITGGLCLLVLRLFIFTYFDSVSNGHLSIPVQYRGVTGDQLS
jgi:hypothetical protein